MTTMKIDHKDLRAFWQDLKRWRIRHMPFRRVGNQYEIELMPSPKVSLLLIKYPLATK